MSLKLSYPEKTNLYLTNLNNKSKIDVLIPDGVLKCESYEDFYINVIKFNTFHNFYNVIEGYNNKFNIIIDNSTNIICSIPDGNINAFTIREYINNHSILKNHIYVIYDKFKNTFEFQKISNSSLQLQIINAHSLLGFSKSENIKRFLDPSVKFIPLQGFSDNQVQDILNKVDLYLDLGNLPGKDRLPREAIMAGCPIMITTLGAGFNAEDFPVPSQYKLQLDVISPVEAAQSVLKVLKLGKLENFKMQTLFRESVSKEKEFFYREVREFVRQFTGS